MTHVLEAGDRKMGESVYGASFSGACVMGIKLSRARFRTPSYLSSVYLQKVLSFMLFGIDL